MLAGMSSFAPQAMAQPSADAAKELPAVQVQATADKPDGLRATTTRVGKVLQDPQDIPQAITTVTHELMEQQQVGSLREALRNVSGISFNAAEGGRSGDNMNLRGFYTFGDMYLDGIRDTAQYNRETFALEQVDVLRGAGAMLFGRGQAGGVINQVSKTPLSYEQNKITTSVGTNGYTELAADINKPINESTSIRINAMKRDEGSWRSNPTTGTEAEVHRQGVAISLGLNQDTDNKFWLNYLELQTHDNPDYGVSFDAATRAPGTALAASTFFGNDKTFDNSDTRLTTLVNEVKLSGTSQLRTQLRMGDYDRSYWAKTPSLTTVPDASGGVGGNQTRVSHYKTTTLQSDYSNQFKAFGMDHEAIAGVEYLNEDSYRKALQNYGTTAAPDFRPYQQALTGTASSFKSDSYAVYVQDTVEFVPQWKATAGVRRDQMDAKYSSTTSPALKYGENSYRAALSFHPTDDIHYYLSWSDSFSPTADLYQLTVVPQPAERSDVIELGAKWLLLDGDLSLRAAIYQATKNWERSADLESTATILTKMRRTNGIELEAAGRITEKWEVFAGLSLMDARILEVAENVNTTTGAITLANSGYAGQVARNSPPYTFNLWTSYKVDSQWTVAGGVEAKGERNAVNPSSALAVPTLNGAYHPNIAPSYVRWDAMVAYEINQWKLQFNIKNLFDQLYFDAVYDNGGFTVPGVRRSATVSAEYRF
ncbi:TonB-dependent siderophore receptor [Rhodoferax lacus]|uniref:TonB-dependent siderophore receptor n=2 Tax=Rhodoferax lacus TaxID=2184758 RepID=A0A3E1RGD0_9BURK|nr:TonB-dependent siderophore receptor [Rhodoferax lacus]